MDPWDDSVYRGRVYLVPGPRTNSGLVKERAVATVESELSGTQFGWDMVAARSTADAAARMTHSACIRTDRSDCHSGQTMKGMGEVNADGYDDVSVFIGWNTDDAPLNHIIFGAPR